MPTPDVLDGNTSEYMGGVIWALRWVLGRETDRPLGPLPQTQEARYSMKRFKGTEMEGRFDFLDHTTTVGMVKMIFGEVPTTLEAGGEFDEEWKVHLGAEHWLIVRRVR